MSGIKDQRIDPVTAARLRARALPFQSRESFSRSEYDQRYSRTTKNLCVAYSFAIAIFSAVLLYGWMDFYGGDLRILLFVIILLCIIFMFIVASLILFNQDWSWTRIEIVMERRGVDVEDIEPFALDDYGQKVKNNVLEAYDKMEYELMPEGERLLEKYDVRFTNVDNLADDDAS